MVAYVLGNYFVDNGLLTRGQLQTVMSKQDKVKVQLGTIAVSEGLMTQAQADAVNNLQAAVDKRFGDIAVDKEFLTPRQVSSLLKEQGNEYLIFMQTVLDDNLMTSIQFETAVKQFQKETGVTTSRLEAMKSDSIHEIVSAYILPDMDQHSQMVSVMARMMVRLVDRHAYIGKAYQQDDISLNSGIFQVIVGKEPLEDGFLEVDNGIVALASGFAKEPCDDNDELAKDAAGEFLNCINGLYITSLSKENINKELQPQEFVFDSVPAKDVSGRRIFHVPVFISNGSFEYVIIE